MKKADSSGSGRQVGAGLGSELARPASSARYLVGASYVVEACAR